MASIQLGPQAYRAVLFPGDSPIGSSTFERIRADPSTVILDSTESLAHQIASLRPGPVPDWVVHWAYFPWRRTMVAIPDPDMFRRLRFDRNRFQITTDEQHRFADIRIGVAGLSVGHSVALALAMEGLCGLLRLADFDHVELSNLNRLPATVLDLGVNKAVVAARRIAEVNPYLAVEVDERGVQQSSVAAFVEDLDIVVDECDSLDIKIELRLAARERGVPVLMATSDRGLFDVERFDIEADLDIFHGLLGATDPTELHGLSSREKAPYVMRILEAQELSPRLAASLVETERTVSTWPQLAGEVSLGAASVATAVRRIVRGEPLPSGRTRIDLDRALAGMRPPSPEPVVQTNPLPTTEPARETSAPEAIVDAIRRAPSGGNSQPWIVTRYPGRIEICELSEGPTAMDVGFRGTHVAIGAAAFNAAVAAAAFGVVGPIEVIEDPTTGHPSVSIHIGRSTDDELARYYDAMIDRMSNRTAGVRAPFADDQLGALHEAVRKQGGRLVVATDSGRLAELGEIFAASDRLRYLVPALHQQMIGELSWPGRDQLNRGIDVRTLALDSADLAKLGVATRPEVMTLLSSWGVGEALGDHTRNRVRGASGLAAVTVSHDNATDYVIGGMAMERFWVLATRFGLGVYPVSPLFMYARNDDELSALAPGHIAELRTLRDRFGHIMGIDETEALVLVLRVVHHPAGVVRSERLPRRANILDKLE